MVVYMALIKAMLFKALVAMQIA